MLLEFSDRILDPTLKQPCRTRGARGGGNRGENTSPSGFQDPSGILTALAVAI